jgi:hypothetical protein
MTKINKKMDFVSLKFLLLKMFFRDSAKTLLSQYTFYYLKEFLTIKKYKFKT